MANKIRKAVVVFVPVIHKGYVDFLKKHKGEVFIFGDLIIKRFTSLVRDLRLMAPKDTVRLIKSFGLAKTVSILDKKNIERIRRDRPKIVMPDEDVSREVAAKEFSGLKVSFEPVFLRWNKNIVVKEYEPPADREITSEAFAKENMILAETESGKSADWWRKIGAVLVKDGKIIARGFNKHIPSKYHLDTFGDPRSNFNAGERYDLVLSIHAEAALVAEAARSGNDTSGASLFVTTFPCPVCARLICEAGIKKVYYRTGYSLMDAEKIMKHYGVEIILVK